MSENDMLFTASQISVREMSIITKEQLKSVIFEKSDSGFYARLEELGIEINRGENGEPELFSSVEERFLSAVNEMISGISEWQLCSLFMRKYDIYNIKLALKHADGKLGDKFLPVGSNGKEDIVNALKDKDFLFFSPKTALALSEAVKMLPRNGDMGLAGNLITRAVFEDTAKFYEKFRSSYFRNLIEFSADSENIMSSLKKIHFHRKNSFKIEDIYLFGGRIALSELEKALSADGLRSTLAMLARENGYDLMSNILMTTPDVKETELAFAREFYRLGEQTDGLSDGMETVMKYLLRLEKEAKNLRLVILGRKYGIEPKETAEMLL